MKATSCVEAATAEPGRRTFLKASGGLVLGLSLPLGLHRAAAATDLPPPFSPNAFIRIDRQSRVTLVMPMAEMGQGIYTAMAMLLAEELEIGLDQVRLEHAPADDALYANAILHVQTTGLSTSVRAFWTPLRQAGAVARTLLVEAAARQWAVDPATCRAQRGTVAHPPSQRSLRYGALVDAAATLPVPAAGSVRLKDPKDFRLIGTRAKRLDTPAKVNGRAVFGIDVQVPGMKIRRARDLAGVRRQRQVARRSGGAARQGRAPGGAAARGRRRHRRPHRRGEEGTCSGRDRVGRRAARGDDDRARRPAARAGIAAARRGRTPRRRRRQGVRRRGQAPRRRLSAALPGARGDGADELHGPRAQGRVRHLGRNPGADADAGHGGRDHRACRGRRWRSTTSCSAAASGAGSRPTARCSQ